MTFLKKWYIILFLIALVGIIASHSAFVHHGGGGKHETLMFSESKNDSHLYSSPSYQTIQISRCIEPVTRKIIGSVCHPPQALAWQFLLIFY